MFLDKPKILKRMEDSYFLEIGSSFTLPCEWSIPPTSLKWTFTNRSGYTEDITEEVMKEKQLTIDEEKGLTFENVSQSSVGIYTCVGSNKFGEDMCTGEISEVDGKSIDLRRLCIGRSKFEQCSI